MKFKVNDKVKVLSGKDRGKLGSIIALDHKNDLVTVDGVNLRIRHKKPDNQHPEGSKEEFNAPIRASKLALVDKSDKVIKVKYGFETDKAGKVKKVRINKKTGVKI